MAALLKQWWRKPSNLARVGDFTVRYVARWSFDFMYDEIFRDEQYRFETDVPAPFVIDAGANIGLAALYFKTIYPAASILAIEPDPRAFACLRENVAQTSGVETVNAALAESARDAELLYDSGDPGSLRMSLVPGRARSDASRRVDAVRLSSFVEREVEFMKLDVEGVELSVLRELATAGKLSFVRQALIEHHHDVSPENRLSAVLALLEEHGFAYRIEAKLDRPLPKGRRQDVRVYAYRV